MMFCLCGGGRGGGEDKGGTQIVQSHNIGKQALTLYVTACSLYGRTGNACLDRVCSNEGKITDGNGQSWLKVSRNVGFGRTQVLDCA